MPKKRFLRPRNSADFISGGQLYKLRKVAENVGMPGDKAICDFIALEFKERVHRVTDIPSDMVPEIFEELESGKYGFTGGRRLSIGWQGPIRILS
jgi:hypothetical protein